MESNLNTFVNILRAVHSQAEGENSLHSTAVHGLQMYVVHATMLHYMWQFKGKTCCSGSNLQGKNKQTSKTNKKTYKK